MGRVGQLLLALAALGRSTFAAPASVDVTVQAAFSAPPYLVELLETAADQNSSSYWPLLDRIADGYFDEAKTDKQLYEAFERVLKDDGHITDPHALSTWKLALSLHASVPRIEAQYQYWRTASSPSDNEQDISPRVDWNPIFADSEAGEHPDDEKFSHLSTDTPLSTDRRVFPPINHTPPVLYADITSQSFREFHKQRRAGGSREPYWLRHRPSWNAVAKPLAVSGYGVEMALKRTDYIVIDDRASGSDDTHAESPQADMLADDESVTDLKPLSASELQHLGLKTASYVLQSEDKLDTLHRIVRDFPRYSAAIASGKIDQDLKSELQENAAKFLPPGSNTMWINGIHQMTDRSLDAFALLEQLRKEQELLAAAKSLGLSSKQALDLITHSELTDQLSQQGVQRYDWRDDDEGGNIIIWMNDIEKDRRYIDWPESLRALLKRTFPGQLPSVRRNIHHVTVPTDFSDRDHLALVVDGLQSFVKRMIPVRFGIVPLVHTTAAEQSARIIYHLCDTYGLAAALHYLEIAVSSSADLEQGPLKAHFDAAIVEKQLRKDRTAMSFDQVLADKNFSTRLAGVQTYNTRLALTDTEAPFLANGVPISRGEEWMQTMSQRVSQDLRVLQEGVYTEVIDDESNIADIFLVDGSNRRSALIIPESEKDTKFPDLSGMDILFEALRGVPANKDTDEPDFAQVLVLGDFDSAAHRSLVNQVLEFRKKHDNVELFVIPTNMKLNDKTGDTAALVDLITAEEPVTIEALETIMSTKYKELEQPADNTFVSGSRHYSVIEGLLQQLGIDQGSSALIINGRLVGPFKDPTQLTAEDMEVLLAYERQKRSIPLINALKEVAGTEILSSPGAFAKLVSFVARSSKSDAPEGIFEGSSNERTSIYRNLECKHSCFEIGDIETAGVQIYVAIDPASETSQRWVPLIKVLTELDGVYAKIFLNPREYLTELPVKRFYRNVLHSAPEFDEAGAVKERGAHFGNLPADALLTIGMDLPPAWLVSPKESVHDLDNLRLSSLKGESVSAIYQLDHILIEGHTKDVTATSAPRGAQVALSVARNKRVADTLIMANLGYFQFKANPGYYHLSMHDERSEEVYKIDTIGLPGVAADNTGFAMTSFRGTTLYPRLSRKPGMEKEDVLEPSTAKAKKNGKAGGVLDAIGLNDWFGKSEQKVVEDKAVSTLPHADINIFSVASGHLYERMLNIMMVSVMKHTSHTVKFWFIEQFLSPSFKAFLPILAEEYGFRYEMVTFKWPHWLRGQKEKQREIWGYKILFLDVLFPLDLNKVIFVDADQIVRTDMYELVQYDLQGAPYGFTPMCDSRVEMEGFRFWKQGYWKNFLRGLPYHISALYVVDLARFRQMAAGDRLRQQYHQLSADPNSLSNLDQDLPNHMQHVLPIHSLPQEWLWCETWCSDESLGVAKTIDLCNNPQTKEPKLERARRQVPEWTVYDDEIAAVAQRKVGSESVPGLGEGEQERLQAEEYEKKKSEEKEEKGDRIRDEL